MDIGLDETNHSDILRHLKSTVETLLACQTPAAWNVFGGIHRLQVAIIKVLKHGFRFTKENGEPDFWVFIQGLSWLQPALAASPSFVGNPITGVRSPSRNSNKALTWIYRSLETDTLSEKLSWLLSDQEHVLSCYNANAFLRQSQYSEATLICLKAVELKQISILAKIDSSLYLKQKPISTQRHRRCLSNPEQDIVNSSASSPVSQEPFKGIILPDVVHTKTINFPSKFSSFRRDRLNNSIVNSVFKSSSDETAIKKKIKRHQLKKWFTCSDIYALYQKKRNCLAFYKRCELSRPRRQSLSELPSPTLEDYSSGENNLEYFSEILRVKYDKPKVDSRSKRITQLTSKKSDSLDSLSSIGSAETIIYRDKIARPKRKRRVSFLKLPFQIWESSDDDHSNCSDDTKTLVQSNATSTTDGGRKSFIENGGNITLPMTIGSYPKPSPGQSIMSFLSSGAFTRTNAELDRENAHFSVAEALIAVLEQVKCDQQFRLMDDIMEESDEEINHLKKIIRIRRQQKQNEKFNQQLNEISTDTSVTTDQSVNSLSSSVYSTSESVSTDQEDEASHKKSNRLSPFGAGLSVSKLSLNSNSTADFDCLSNSSTSAESVAISLLRGFNENKLPAASEFEWLISEGEVPQKILPLPNSFAISKENDTASENVSLLRGTQEWAPPRPQIIFTPHPPPIRRLLMEKQSFRCASCGTRVDQKYASKFRYCEYLGRYFCTGCHSGQTAVIPGRVLTKWDFSKYSVSNFSHQLLDQLSTDPLFNVVDLNSALYNNVRALQKVRLLRVALFYLKDFIFTCKHAENLAATVKSDERSYVYSEPDCYSLVDFVNVKNGKMFKRLTELKKLCENHTNSCQRCQSHGFFCEICKRQEIIFPWQLSNVLRCNECSSCYHIKCYNRKRSCPKCFRSSRSTSGNEPDAGSFMDGNECGACALDHHSGKSVQYLRGRIENALSLLNNFSILA